MKRRRYSEKQTVSILNEREAGASAAGMGASALPARTRKMAFGGIQCGARGLDSRPCRRPGPAGPRASAERVRA